VANGTGTPLSTPQSVRVHFLLRLHRRWDGKTAMTDRTRTAIENSCRGYQSRRRCDTQVASEAAYADFRSPHRRQYGHQNSEPRSRETGQETGHRIRPLTANRHAKSLTSGQSNLATAASNICGVIWQMRMYGSRYNAQHCPTPHPFVV